MNKGCKKAKKIMFSSAFVCCLFVCSFGGRIMDKLLNRFSQNSVKRWKMPAPQKKPLDFGGNIDHVTLTLWIGRVGFTVR